MNDVKEQLENIIKENDVILFMKGDPKLMWFLCPSS